MDPCFRHPRAKHTTIFLYNFPTHQICPCRQYILASSLAKHLDFIRHISLPQCCPNFTTNRSCGWLCHMFIFLDLSCHMITRFNWVHPYLLCCNTTASKVCLWLSGILKITSASSLWNFSMISSLLHHFRSGSISSETHHSHSSSPGGWITPFVGWFGIHLSDRTLIFKPSLTL